nr:hypothetical protein [Candidatus Babeliales bacterium]
MKLRHSVIFALSCNLSLHGMLMDSIPQIKNIEAELKSAEKKSKTSLSSQASQLVDFSYKQEPLKEILNHFAAKLNFNILYPETESITTLASFDAGKKITLCEAWNFVQMILEQAGYTLIMRDASTYVIMS